MLDNLPAILHIYTRKERKEPVNPELSLKHFLFNRYSNLKLVSMRIISNNEIHITEA